MIRPGMIEEQVIAILGGPAGDYRDGAYEPPDDYQTAMQHWFGDEGNITIVFDKDGQVISADYLPVLARKPGIIERLRAWLGL